MIRYWCFDEEALERALKEWISRGASWGHPEAQKTMESGALIIRSFLSCEEAKRHKLVNEVKLGSLQSEK